jgi:hypothetical protein
MCTDYSMTIEQVPVSLVDPIYFVDLRRVNLLNEFYFIQFEGSEGKIVKEKS